MQKPSRAYQLVEERLGCDLAPWVADLRDGGASWNTIAVEILTMTGVSLTAETLRNWFGAAHPGRAGRANRAKAAS